jgi:integrase
MVTIPSLFALRRYLVAMPRSLVLTYDKANRVWKKVIKGRAFYFGKSASKGDREGYLAALDRYRRELPEILRAAQDQSSPTASAASRRRHTQNRSRQLAHWADQFVKQFEVRAARGEISKGRCRGVRYWLRPFVEHFGGEFAIASLNEGDLQDFFTALNKRYAESDQSGHTHYQQVSVAKSFVRFLWRSRLLDEMPRNLTDRCFSVGIPRSEPKIFEWLAKSDERPDGGHMKRLTEHFASRNDLLATCFYLGINCGFTFADIADLRARDYLWESKSWLRIERGRAKTGVFGSWILWDRTIELLDLHKKVSRSRYNSDAHLFGAPHSSHPLNRSAGSHCNLSREFKKVVVELFGEDERSHRTLRKSGASYCLHRWSGTERLYLAHEPTSVAERHYARFSPHRLDMVLCYMAEDFGVEPFKRRYPLEEKRPETRPA